MHNEAKNVYRAQGILLGLMANEMPQTIEYRAMAGVLRRLDQRMYELSPSTSPTPAPAGASAETLLGEWDQFSKWNRTEEKENN
jgi:hypothetical protein